jgi:hypothetical protein
VSSTPAHLSKPGTDQYRMTVDLRVPNASTKPTAWPKPNLQDELHDLHVSEEFATLDLFTRLLADTSGQRLSRLSIFHHAGWSIHTDAVLYITRKGTQYLQSVIIVMMDDINSNIKIWLDDCLLHTKTEDDFLATLIFLRQCQMYELKLHAKNCVLFATTVRYCGRLIAKDGVRFDPKNMEALQTMREPQNGADLIQYVAAVNWMRSAIPNYSKRVATHSQAALTKVFEGKSRRTKKAAAAVSLVLPPGPI